MRTTLRCPKCQGRKIIHVPVVRDNGYNRLMIEYRMGFFGDQEYGEFESYICRACGYAEMYVKGAPAINVDQIDGATLLDGEKDVGHPYR